MSVVLQLQHSVTAQGRPGPNALQVAVMFGLSLEACDRQTIIPPIELTLGPGTIVFITGVSGGGKSTLLRLIEQALATHRPADAAASPGCVSLDRLPAMPDAALVEALARPAGSDDDNAQGASLETVCGWLSRAGLNDAAVMLRRPRELSEGQRHRLRLAQAMAAAEQRAEAWSVLLADEFGSTLDRTTAQALAQSVRRWVSRSNTCLVAATAHDDLLEPLSPDVLVEVEPGGKCSVHVRAS